MKKFLRFVFVFVVCTVLSFPVWSNPTPVYAGKISHLYFFEDGSFVLELYFMWLGEEDYIVLSGSSGCTLIDVSDVNVGDFLIIDSSEYPDLELDPTSGTLDFFETFYLINNYNSVFSIGTSAYNDVRPIPLGCGISNLTYSSESVDSKYVYDTQLNLMQSQPVTKGVVKASVYNLQDELLSGFIIGVQSSAVEESFCSSDDGFYYLNIYWDATMETTAALSNLANTIEYKSMTGTPLDTTYITFTYNVPSSISFTGTIELEGQTNHEGSYVYLEFYNPDHDILYHKIINEDGTFALEIPSGVYRLAYFHDHYTPNLTGNFLPYLESKNVFKSLQEEEMVVNLISPFRESPLVDSTYYLFSDIYVPSNNTLEIYDAATVILPLPKEIMVEGTVNITGAFDDPVSFISDYSQSPSFLFNIYEETGSVFMNYADYEYFTAIFNLESSTLGVSNTNFIDNELIISGKGNSLVNLDNCSFVGSNPDSVLIILRDSSYVEIDNCMFQSTRVFDIYDHAHIHFNSCSILNCDPSIVWDYGFIDINYSVFDDASITLNYNSQAHIDHSTFLNNDCALAFGRYGDYSSNYPDTTFLLQNSIFYNNNREVRRTSGNGYLNFNIFYPYQDDIYFSNIPDFGILTTVNNNNDSCDIYQNIFMDPLLDDDYHLTWNSPCINAGDPNTPKDPDSTITDMGAYFYDLSTLIQEAKNDQSLPARSYPNPATEQVTFDISHENGISGTAVITLYNLEGVPVATAYEPLPPSESLTRITIPLKNRGLATGLYVYTIEVPGRKPMGGKLSVVH